MTMLIESMRVPAYLVLQNSTSVAQERNPSWSSDSVNCLTIVAVACPRLLADSMDLAHLSQSRTYVIFKDDKQRNLVSQEFSERQSEIKVFNMAMVTYQIRRHGFNMWHACATDSLYIVLSK